MKNMKVCICCQLRIALSSAIIKVVRSEVKIMYTATAFIGLSFRGFYYSWKAVIR